MIVGYATTCSAHASVDADVRRATPAAPARCGLRVAASASAFAAHPPEADEPEATAARQHCRSLGDGGVRDTLDDRGSPRR